VCDDKLLKCSVKCPTCGDIFLVERGLRLAKQNSERRSEERLPAMRMQMILDDTLREFEVRDISSKGVGFVHGGWRFELGQRLVFDLLRDYEPVLAAAQAQVVRVDPIVVGCVFTATSAEHTALLEKLSSSHAWTAESD